MLSKELIKSVKHTPMSVVRPPPKGLIGAKVMMVNQPNPNIMFYSTTRN